MLKFHVNGSPSGRYDIIIGRDLLTNLGIDIKFSNIIEFSEGPYQGYKSPMLILDDYKFKPVKINIRSSLDDLFLDAYINECHESEPIRAAAKTVRTILYAKYENDDLHKKINEHCKHLMVAKQA